MKIRWFITLLLAGMQALPSSSLAEQQHAHVHGTATLQVAIDDDTVTALLDSPLASLTGFEHKPSSAAEKTTLQAMAALLRQPEKWLVFPAAAGCRNVSVKLVSPLLENSGSNTAVATVQAHNDLEGEFIFHCTDTRQLASITVNLFDAAFNLQDLDLQVIHAGGQSAQELDRQHRTLHWQP